MKLLHYTSKKILVFFCALLFLSFFCAAQDSSEVKWENKNRVVRFDFDNDLVFIRLKNFYGLWLDDEYQVNWDFSKKKLLLTEDELYVRFWYKILPEIDYYVPQNNFSEITMDNQATDEYVYAYLFTGTKTFRVRYWKCSMDVYDEQKKITHTIDSVEYQLPKYLIVGGIPYTCIMGRGEKLRNNIFIDFEQEFPKAKFIKSDNDEKRNLVLDEPFLLRIK
ncbi:MAG: hypothetical protein K6G52_06840 [Treponemataceae bacterium]|nr:hypothetical protein [Treponemataceae bacterium]